jgi:hypothetical protein
LGSSQWIKKSESSSRRIIAGLGSSGRDEVIANNGVNGDGMVPMMIWRARGNLAVLLIPPSPVLANDRSECNGLEEGGREGGRNLRMLTSGGRISLSNDEMQQHVKNRL